MNDLERVLNDIQIDTLRVSGTVLCYDTLLMGHNDLYIEQETIDSTIHCNRSPL